MKSARLKALVGVAVTLIVVVSVYGVYNQQHSKVANLNSQSRSLQTSINTAKQLLTTTNNLNNGVVAATTATPSNTVSLLNGKVTFTMPSGWVPATASKYAQQCYIGGLSGWFCLDTTTIVPSSLNNNSTTSTYSGINISVYENNGKSPLETFTDPTNSCGSSCSPFTTMTIDGYRAYYANAGSTKLEYGDQFNNESYTIANKSYVVVVSSNVNNNAGPNGTTKFNDNSQYSPVVKSFAESLKMQGN